MHGKVRPWARRCALLALTTTGLVLATAALAFATTTGEVALTLPSWDSNYAWSNDDGYGGWRSDSSGLDPFGYGLRAFSADGRFVQSLRKVRLG